MITFPAPLWLARWYSQPHFHFGMARATAHPALNELATCDRARLPQFVRESPVALKYLDLLGSLPWNRLPDRLAQRFAPDCPPLSYAAFLAGYLIKLDQHLLYFSDWHTYLSEHPALLWVLGFPLAPAREFAWGFDVARSLPTHRHFSRLLRELPTEPLQWLLDETVRLLAVELDAVAPAWGDCISLDTKHIIAWVKENNPKAYISGKRYDKTQHPKGDPDARLGCKRKHNQGKRRDSVEALPTPRENPVPAAHLEIGEYYWGYGSGIVATQIPDYGEIVLAELTQPFDQPDVSYFHPLMAQVERRLGRRPRYGAFDAAFDAFYVYEYFDAAHGFAAVPFVARGPHPHRTFNAEGLPLCDAGLPMTPRYTFHSRATLIAHERTRYACPLRFPEITGAACPIAHPNWAKQGCVSTMASSKGARLRYELDRHSERYEDVYRQRTASERINSQAVDLGIEHPKLRNGASIAHHNTLLYVLINLHALQRIRQRRAQRELVESATKSVRH